MNLAAAARRTLLGLLAALGASAALASAVAAQADDMSLGDRNAPVTVVEYASVGCPHCARWSNEVFAPFKAKFIDTGRVRFVVREMLTGEPDLAAAGFLVARCAGPAKYFEVIEAEYRRQALILDGEAKAGDVLAEIARSAGLSDAKFNACLDDAGALQALNARAERHARQDGVDSTPTFFVGGKRIEGYATLDQLAAAMPTPPARR
jgi:protein-disulfide isomerase